MNCLVRIWAEYMNLIYTHVILTSAVKRTVLRGVRLWRMPQALPHSGLPLTANVEAVEKPQMPYFIENRELYHIDY